jgi:hypothetical protein
MLHQQQFCLRNLWLWNRQLLYRPAAQFNNHFIGLRYQYSSFKTTMKDDATQYSKDRFQAAELWGWVEHGQKMAGACHRAL